MDLRLINIDDITLIRFIPEAPSTWKYYPSTPPKTFMGFIIKKGLPKGWRNGQGGYYSSMIKLLREHYSIQYDGSVMTYKPYLEITLCNKDKPVLEYLKTNKQALIRIEQLKTDSKGKFNVLS